MQSSSGPPTRSAPPAHLQRSTSSPPEAPLTHSVGHVPLAVTFNSTAGAAESPLLPPTATRPMTHTIAGPAPDRPEVPTILPQTATQPVTDTIYPEVLTIDARGQGYSEAALPSSGIHTASTPLMRAATAPCNTSSFGMAGPGAPIVSSSAAPNAKAIDAAMEVSDAFTGNDDIVVIMRHSARLDDAFDDFADIPISSWEDKLQRPYDPPILDFDLPVRSAVGMAKYKIAAVVSSPFRRCLQTAGLMARELGLRKVCVDNRLGEYLPMVARCCRKAGFREMKVEYLTDEQAQKAVNIDGDVSWDRLSNIPQEPDDLNSRVGEAIPAIMAAHRGQNILIVTHGDLFNCYLPELFEGVGKFKADVAGWAAIQGPHGPRVEADNAILETHRVEQL